MKITITEEGGKYFITHAGRTEAVDTLRKALTVVHKLLLAG